MPQISGSCTRFDSKGYRRSALAEPTRETRHAFGNRGARPEANCLLESTRVSVGFRNISRLHRKEFQDGGSAGRLLDQTHEIENLNRIAVADIENLPGSPASCRIRRVPLPPRVCYRRVQKEANDCLRRIIDIGKVPPHPTVVEQPDRRPCMIASMNSHIAMSGRPQGP